jgi:hypothetical protein
MQEKEQYCVVFLKIMCYNGENSCSLVFWRTALHLEEIMKKTILALVLALSVLAGIACFIVPASAARIAPYLNKYEEVAAPAEADKILMPSNNIAIWWGQESIVGEWTPPTGYTDENRYGDAPGCICWMDNDMKTALLRYGIPPALPR